VMKEKNIYIIKGKKERRKIEGGSLLSRKQEECKEEVVMPLRTSLNSNHVQSDDKDDICALKSSFLCLCTCPPF
jgi:hypothetical protein